MKKKRNVINAISYTIIFIFVIVPIILKLQYPHVYEIIQTVHTAEYNLKLMEE